MNFVCSCRVDSAPTSRIRTCALGRRISRGPNFSPSALSLPVRTTPRLAQFTHAQRALERYSMGRARPSLLAHAAPANAALTEQSTRPARSRRNADRAQRCATQASDFQEARERMRSRFPLDPLCVPFATPYAFESVERKGTRWRGHNGGQSEWTSAAF